jgi:class 3 adenylate cyclase
MAAASSDARETPRTLAPAACLARAERERRVTAPVVALALAGNTGDIVVEDGEHFGRRVNVAARLEGLAPSPKAREVSRNAGS